MRIRRINREAKILSGPKQVNNHASMIIPNVENRVMFSHTEGFFSQVVLPVEIGQITLTTPGPVWQSDLPNIKSSKTITASEWVEKNRGKLQKYAGEYVAINHNGVVATADNLDDAFLKAKNKGVINPLVFKVPKSPRLKVV